MSSYQDAYRKSLDNPQAFWMEAADAIHWERRWDQVLDDSNPPFYHWFRGGELNTCFNALDRHADGGRADQPALIYDSAVTQSQRTFTYGELRDLTARFAGVLAGLGIEKGDRVGALGVVAFRDLDRVAGVANIHELHALDDAAVIDVQAWDNALCQTH